MRRFPQLGVLLAALVCGGCGGGGKGSVEGLLTVSGKPVTTGALITFIGANGEKAQGIVQSDGRFLADNVPAGSVKVTVENAALPPPEDPFKDNPKGKRLPPYKIGEAPPPHKPAVLGTQVPPRYRDVDNGLSYTIKAGETNELNVELTP